MHPQMDWGAKGEFHEDSQNIAYSLLYLQISLKALASALMVDKSASHFAWP